VPGVPIAAVCSAIVLATPSYGSAALQSGLARAILAHGIPAGAASLGWLGALALRAASLGGVWLPAFASAAFAATALILVDARERALGRGRSTGLSASLAALCLLDGLHSGGGAGAWCCAALALLVLEVPSRRNVAVYAALTLAWCNLEPQGLLALAFACAVALGASLERANGLRLRWATVAAAALATLCTPAGAGFPRAAFEELRLGGAAAGIVTTVPAITAPHAYPLGLLALLVLALAFGSRERGLRGALPLGLAFVLALANGAFVPLFGIVAAPLVVAGFRGARRPSMPALSFGLAGAAALAVAFVARAAPAAQTAAQPFALAAREAVRGGPRARLFCANVDWCDVASADGERVVMDGRIAVSGAPARAAQRTIVVAKPGWERALARSGATAVLAATDSALATLLNLSGSWREVERGERATLFERRGP
jgi:hypothetical protein